MPVAIVDYGVGNLRSVQKAFERFGHAATFVSDANGVAAAERLVLPGVGAFGDAMDLLESRGLVGPLRDYAASGRLMLGVCLGMQLLFDVGTEGGERAGLGVLPGRVVRFDVDRTAGLKVPHMGWNTLDARSPSPLHRDVPSPAAVYFVHGYHVVPSDDAVIATTTDYGGPFVSSVWRGNVMATQFHPEKSQAVGLTMLRNFAEL